MIFNFIFNIFGYFKIEAKIEKHFAAGLKPGLFYYRKLLSATVRQGKSGHFYWIGSDSWGAKIHPVRHQEWAAEGAITILPKRSSLPGNTSYDQGLVVFHRVNFSMCGS